MLANLQPHEHRRLLRDVIAEANFQMCQNWLHRHLVGLWTSWMFSCVRTFWAHSRFLRNLQSNNHKGPLAAVKGLG